MLSLLHSISIERVILSTCTIFLGKWANDCQSRAAFERAISGGSMCQLSMADPLDLFREFEHFVCINDWLQLVMAGYSFLAVVITDGITSCINCVLAAMHRIGVMLCLRALFVSLLTFPPSMRACKCTFTPFNACQSVIYCTDLGFSGHAASNTVAWMGLLQSNARIEIKLIGTALVSTCYVSSVLTRDHYTFDVVVGALSGVAYSTFTQYFDATKFCRKVRKSIIMFYSKRVKNILKLIM